MKLTANDGTSVYLIFLGRHVLIRLWVLQTFSERYSTDSSQGVLLGIELTLKLWKFCHEFIHIYIFLPLKKNHYAFESVGID